ncbi:DNA ligase 1-like isoform X4 [Formica exsecta]|uniref:DNA ligase 1-like isoform X4 n=1 Tax=Formica exsecta TaxID=72781 RepID=UPI001144802A|nr:DNA ligase 1-like isoform X4 [Formica exsecta]
MNSYKREKSKSALEEKERKDKQERLWQVRQQWYIAQEMERQHEARKSKMIEEYERNRAQALKIHQKQRVLQRSKSNNPQRRTTDYKYPEESKMSSSKYQKNTIIDEKELHRIKIDVYKKKDHRTRSQDTSKNKIERNIDPDDIVLPRRKNEGLRPIFEKRKTAQDEMQRIRFVRDNKLVPEKQLSDEESSDTWESTSINTYKTNTQYSKIFKNEMEIIQ